MARPQRNNVDYFPLYCEEGKKMYYLEETYGNDGFATFIKILRELARTDYHYLDLSQNTTRMFLSAKCKVSKQTLEAIINDLVELGKFDKMLWEENNIIWCQDFVDSIQDAYLRRNNDCIDKKGLLTLLESKGIRKQEKSKHKQAKCELKDTVNPQIKEDYIKEDYIKEDYIKEKKNKEFNFKNSLIDLGVEKQVASDWIKVRAKKKAANTETSFNRIKSEIEKSHLSANECITIAVERSWSGFNHEWVKDIKTIEDSKLHEYRCQFHTHIKRYKCNSEEEARELFYKNSGAYPETIRQVG